MAINCGKGKKEYGDEKKSSYPSCMVVSGGGVNGMTGQAWRTSSSADGITGCSIATMPPSA